MSKESYAIGFCKAAESAGVGLKDIMDLGAKYSPTFRRIMSNK